MNNRYINQNSNISQQKCNSEAINSLRREPRLKSMEDKIDTDKMNAPSFLYGFDWNRGLFMRRQDGIICYSYRLLEGLIKQVL